MMTHFLHNTGNTKKENVTFKVAYQEISLAYRLARSSLFCTAMAGTPGQLKHADYEPQSHPKIYSSHTFFSTGPLHQ